MTTRTFLWLLLLFMLGVKCFAQTLPGERRTVKTVFEDRAPLASTAESNKRFKWKDKIKDIDLANESLQVYVPNDDDSGKPLGLLVWISPTSLGGVPDKSWLDALDAKRLIWVGANDSGNDRLVADRIRLAIEAVYNIKQKHTIDDDRIYVSGFSGGGRCASMSGTTFSDVFTGGAICFGGVNFYRDIPVPEKKNEIWQATFYPPPANLLPEQKRARRYVLIAGDKDFNLSNTIGVYKSGFLREQYQHVTVMQIPDLPHRIPDGEWLAKAIDTADEPISKLVAARAATTQRAATRPVSIPTRVPDPSTEADKLLGLAKSYVAAGSYGPARARLEKVVATYPDTPQARDARELLEEIRSK